MSSIATCWWREIVRRARRSATGYGVRGSPARTDAAYVAMNYPEGPDTVFAYHRSGEEGRLSVPTEFTQDLPECTLQSRLSNGVVLPDRPCPHLEPAAVPVA